MALTSVDKVKINKYLKEHAFGDIYYIEMCDCIGKRGKVTDIEFLEYFTDFVLNEFRQMKKISIKQTVKMISIIKAFLKWIHAENSNISEQTLDKIRSIKELFNEYLNRNKISDEEVALVNINIDSLLESVNKLYPTEVSNESISKYIIKIAELEASISLLEKEVQELKRVNDNLQSLSDEKTTKIDSLTERNSALVQESRDRKSEIKKLKKSVSSLEEKISELEKNSTETQALNSKLSSYKERYEKLRKNTDKLYNELKEQTAIKVAQQELEVRQTKIEDLIYQKLLLDGASIDDILNYITANGIASTREEIVSLLNRMKQKINVDSCLFIGKPIYKVEPQIFTSDGVFKVNVPFESKYYDVMLVSDLHIREFDKKVLKGFDAINDYCVKNNISLILNLGDFFDGFGSRRLEYSNAVKNYKLVEQAISTLVRADGVYHAILGGNHERNISLYGFDPISILANEREDFINLGYMHSTVQLNRMSTNLGDFDIHHPYTFEFSIKVGKDGLDMNGINEYLDKLYNKQGRTRDDSYIDILGHTHKSQINYSGAYCYVPAFFEGGARKGACHLRIYFDENDSIECMVFMPLSYGTKLEKNNEIVYQKIMRR